MISEFAGALIQITIFGLIPLVTYLITKKKFAGFWDYVGLKKSNSKANRLAVLACLLFALPALILVMVSEEFRAIMFDPSSITGKIRAMGLSLESVVVLLLIALFKTSFAEELLFRGFVAKRLISWLGYLRGNLVQSLVFGVIHVLLFATLTSNWLFLLIIFILPSIGSYISVFLNEKVAQGSIIPGWISHGLANVLSYSIVGFLI